MIEKIKVKNIEIPPKEGFDSLLQRIVTSFLLRIPNVLENRRSRLFMSKLSTVPPSMK